MLVNKNICYMFILLCQFVMKRLSKHSNLNDKSINQSINQSVIFKMKHIRGFYLYHYYMTVLLCYLQRTNSIQFLTLNFYFFLLSGWGYFYIKKIIRTNSYNSNGKCITNQGIYTLTT